MRHRDIFLAALDVPAAERAAYLDGACGGDADLRRLVEELLHSHDEAGSFLEHPAVPRPGAEPSRPQETRAVGEESAEGPAPDNAAGAAADVLGFLTPAATPGSLGRLGHYEVREVVGRGGMGVVLRAFDDKLHRVVAVKVLAPALAASGTARQRFVREARAAAAVSHDHVVAIHAVEADGPVAYLVMQMIDGIALEEKVRQTGPLPVKEILRIGMQTAAGLAAAHEQGLVHRDIKPGNLLLENGVERVKITDFGLARAVDDASVSQSGVIAGTPLYMSPEQARGEALDHRSDLFSLGSVRTPRPANCSASFPTRSPGRGRTSASPSVPTAGRWHSAASRRYACATSRRGRRAFSPATRRESAAWPSTRPDGSSCPRRPTARCGSGTARPPAYRSRSAPARSGQTPGR
jgi:serine/threonine protein kinase